MVKLSVRGRAALAILGCAACVMAHAADPLPATTQVVAASTAAAPSQLPFTISTTQDLVVTLTDLQIPAALTSAGVVVTQNGAIAASALLASPAVSATASLPAASGSYTLYVFGVPNAGFSTGTFIACVAPKSNPSNCIQSASLSGAITAQSTANNPTVSTFSTTLTVNTADTFTFNYSDLNFPVSLQTAPSLALFQGSTTIQAPITAGSSVALNPGTYQLLAIAQADATVKSGLYGVTVTGSAANATPILDQTIAVGLTPVPTAASQFVNSAAQSAILKVTDFAFPGALASASALLTRGGTSVGSGTATTGAVTLTLPAGTITVWTYGAAGASAGAFSVDVSTASADLLTIAQGVGPVASTYTYAFATPALAAGSYLVTAADLQFPTQLSGLSFAVAQNGVILQQATAGGSVTAALNAGPAVLLVTAQTPTNAGNSGSGLFDVNVQSTGAAATLVYDKTQIVNPNASLLFSQPLTLAANGSYDATLTDLKFPDAFASLALVISQGSTVLGKVVGSGPVTFAGSPGTYQLTFVASPSTQQLFGLYGLSVTQAPVTPAPTVSLTASATSAATGSSVQLSWTSTNATSCMASGGSFSGTQPVNSTTPVSVVLSATTTYTLACTGTGGTGSGTVTVTATSSGKSGGGRLDLGVIALLGGLVAARVVRRRSVRVWAI